MLGSQMCQIPTSCQAVERKCKKYKYREGGFIITYLNCREKPGRKNPCDPCSAKDSLTERFADLSVHCVGSYNIGSLDGS